MKTRFTITVAVVASLNVLAAVAPAAAQDFTNVDMNALNGQYNDVLNATMNAQLSAMMWQAMNDPAVQQLYVQQMNSGLFYGTFEDFTYKYMYTGGMTEGGYGQAIGTNADLNSRHINMMNGYWNAPDVYGNAYGAWGNGYANNQRDAGTIMLGY